MRFPESRSFSNRLFLNSDFFHCVFQAQTIELIHWQVAKQIDSPVTIAAEAGVDDFLAQATPKQKMDLIEKEQAGGRLVAMTGDGTNDAPALAQADVGVAMNTGTMAAERGRRPGGLGQRIHQAHRGRGHRQAIAHDRGALTTFSIANDVAKLFAILPAMFSVVSGHRRPERDAPAQPGARRAGRCDFQRAHHDRAHPAGAARCRVQAHECGGASAAQHPGVPGRRHHRALSRYLDH